MTTMMHIRSRVTPWDDSGFVHAFEQALAEMERSDEPGHGAKAARWVEHRLHAAGFHDARIDVIQTATDALELSSHWDVRRDG